MIVSVDFPINGSKKIDFRDSYHARRVVTLNPLNLAPINANSLRPQMHTWRSNFAIISSYNSTRVQHISNLHLCEFCKNLWLLISLVYIVTSLTKMSHSFLHSVLSSIKKPSLTNDVSRNMHHFPYTPMAVVTDNNLPI